MTKHDQVEVERVKSYLMIRAPFEIEENNPNEDLTLTVKVINWVHNEIECQLFNISDISIYSQFEAEKEKSRMLSAINT